MTAPKMVLVEWEDALAPDVGETWVPKQAPTPWKPYMVQSVGFLVYDGPEGVLLTSTLTEHHTGQREQIPRGMIRSVKELRPAKPRNR